jgi:hypothetical protein
VGLYEEYNPVWPWKEDEVAVESEIALFGT